MASCKTRPGADFIHDPDSSSKRLNESDTADLAFIKNKPTIPVVPLRKICSQSQTKEQHDAQDSSGWLFALTFSTLQSTINDTNS